MLDQHAAAQGFEGHKHGPLRRRVAHPSQQGGERNRLTADREPVENGLLQRRRARKLLSEQLADPIEERVAGGEKGAHIAAEQLVDRLRDQLERQWVAAVKPR